MGPAHSLGKTPFANVFEVIPGHTITYDDAGLHDRTDHSFRIKEHTDSYEDTISHVRELLASSIYEAKEKSKKEIDYDKVLAMLKANPNTNGIVKGNSTVGARLSKVKILQSAAMLEGGWKPSDDDLAWLANERNALERKNEAVKLNNTRPGTNLIDEYIRLREQESKRFSE